jgi:hypothetical protein
MRYPSIPAALVRERLDDLTSGKLTDMSDLATPSGDGADVDLAALEAAIDEIRGALDEHRAGGGDGLDADQFEGRMAGVLHRALKDLAVEVLDDPAFWAYIAVGRLWFFVRWREDPADRKTETYHVYVDGTKADACVPLRMFLRAQAVEVDGEYSLASAIPAGTDFWRSHVLRVRTGGKSALARAVAIEQRDRRMTVDTVRAYAKRINRRWSNQVIHVLDEQDCEEIATTERP